MWANEQEIYELHVMPHQEQPFHRGRLEQPTHAHREDNPLCGDSVLVELRMTDQHILQEAWWVARGCLVCQASASMLLEHVQGKSLAQIEAFSAADMLALFAARLTPLRQRCCLLAWQALRQALQTPVSRAAGGASARSDSRP